MSFLMADKRRFFAAFGALGGVISGLLTNFFGFHESAFDSWVLGTATDGAFIASLLAFGQSRSLGKSFDIDGIRRALLIGAIGGGIGGVIGMYGPILVGEGFGRFIGWGLGGAAVGFAVRRVIPNLSAKTAVTAGGLGGLAGCLSMYLIGYTVGVATTGAIIGLAIALGEMKVRNMWLDVTIRPKGLSLEKERTVAVTLGPKPVLFGCSGHSDVKLAPNGDAKEFASISLAGGQVTIMDYISRQSRPLAEGQPFEISNASIVLRTKAA